MAIRRASRGGLPLPVPYYRQGRFFFGRTIRAHCVAPIPLSPGDTPKPPPDMILPKTCTGGASPTQKRAPPKKVFSVPAQFCREPAWAVFPQRKSAHRPNRFSPSRRNFVENPHGWCSPNAKVRTAQTGFCRPGAILPKTHTGGASPTQKYAPPKQVFAVLARFCRKPEIVLGKVREFCKAKPGSKALFYDGFFFPKIVPPLPSKNNPCYTCNQSFLEEKLWQ